ncbi:Ger(x)C family spore germination protein [Pseudoneobacillus sp. C159]
MRLIVCCMCMILLIGCTRTKIIDQISIIHVIGYDKNEEGELVGTLLYPDFTKSKNSESLEVRKVSGDTSSTIFQKTNEQTKNQIELSKTLVIVFGEELAKKGVKEVINPLVNNPLVGTNVQIVVGIPSARDFMDAVKKDKTLSIADTVTQNYEQFFMPKTNSHIFLNDYYGKGRDPYTPILGLGTEKKVKINGLAIWKDDQFKLSLNNKQAYLFGLMDTYSHQGFAEVPIQKQSKKGHFVHRNLKNKSKWKVSKLGDQPELTLHLKISTRIMEFPTWIHLQSEADIALIKRAIEKNLNKEITELIKLFQKNKVDPLGLGDIIRAHSRNWNEKVFYEQSYDQLKVKVKTDVKIIQSGLRK